jgi:hypothetical protein
MVLPLKEQFFATDDTEKFKRPDAAEEPAMRGAVPRSAVYVKVTTVADNVLGPFPVLLFLCALKAYSDVLRTSGICVLCGKRV